MNETVIYKADGGVATITLNRPDKLNAMNADLLQGAVDAFEAAANDPGIRVVIFTGAGRGFCAGGDLSSPDTLGSGDTESRISVLQTLQRSSTLLREMPKVAIAAINGPCAGGGFSWAAAEAEHYGFISKRLPDDELMANVGGIANRLLAAAPIALQQIKQNLNDAEVVSFGQALNQEADRHVRAGENPDSAEARCAFMEKRPPKFSCA